MSSRFQVLASMFMKITIVYVALVVTVLLFPCCESIDHSHNGSFVKTNGTHFTINGKPMYLNGFNAYWLMIMASDPSSRFKVSATFQQATKFGMNVARAWAFSDGGNFPLQSSPGLYNQDMFQGLDYVISEAGKHGLFLILSLVNNYEDYGGKMQYVMWAKDRGQNVNNADDFYANTLVKQYYKNHVKVVLTRKNTITGVQYKDDPTIFAWELINEPRHKTDYSGTQIQGWVEEMATYTKSIDNNHLLEIGLEGFYGESMKNYNPNQYLLGTDFISNNKVSTVDFATIHFYPESWLPNLTETAQDTFVARWIQAHIHDCASIIKKPLVIGEFCKSSKIDGYTTEKRDSYFKKVYDAIYTNAKNGGPLVGGLFWQVMAQGMESWSDGCQVVLEESPTTASLIAQQSSRLISLP